MVMDGYDHILDVTDGDVPIEQVARAKGHSEVVNLLEGIRDFEVSKVFYITFSYYSLVYYLITKSATT